MPAPMRSQLALMGDPVLRSRAALISGAVAPRPREMQVLMGDPFLGGFFRALGRGAKAVGKVILGATRALAGLPQPSIGAGTVGLTLPAPPIIEGPISPRIEEVLRRRLPGGIIGPPRTGQIVIPSLPRGAAAGFPRRRRMNPLNPRALRRALRRAQGFAKFARRTMMITTGRPVKVRFKRKR